MPKKKNRQQIVVRERVRVAVRPRPTIKRRRQRTRPMQAMGGNGGAQLGRALSDPWSYAGCVPDGGRGMGCFTIKQSVTGVTGAAGLSYGVFMQLNTDSFSIVDTAAAAGNSPTIPANWVVPTATATINNLYGKIRPICGGIRVVYTGNTINDQGILLLGQLSGDVPPSVLNGATLQSVSNACQFYRTFPLRSGGTVTWRPDEMDDIASFLDTDGTADATTAKPAVPYLIAYVYSAATAGASSCLFELCAQFQGQYIIQNFTPGGPEASLIDAKSAAEPGWYERAKNFANLIEPIMPFVKATATNLLEGAIGSYAPMTRGLKSLGMRNQLRLTEF